MAEYLEGSPEGTAHEPARKRTCLEGGVLVGEGSDTAAVVGTQEGGGIPEEDEDEDDDDPAYFHVKTSFTASSRTE